MKAKKSIKPLMALTLASIIAVGGTLAYLSSQTEEIHNKFTFSNDDKVSITLKEETFGTPGNTDPVSMTPGTDIDKDPAIDVTGNDCYVYIDVIEDCQVTGQSFGDYIDYEILSDWTLLQDVSCHNPENTKTYIYTKGTGVPVVVAGGTEDLYVLKDNKVSVKDGVTQEMLLKAQLNQPSLTFKGYAIQSDNVETTSANTVFINEFKSN